MNEKKKLIQIRIKYKYLSHEAIHLQEKEKKRKKSLNDRLFAY